MPPWLTAGLIAAIGLTLAGIAVTLLANPVTSWIARAPEIGAVVRDKLYWLGRPLEGMNPIVRELPGLFLLFVYLVLLPPFLAKTVMRSFWVSITMLTHLEH